ncbi:Os08g0125250 [Oryza sativa Japonica Group]|uniref:Os08g0125250 protein n=1 Tax=Oryza sativa subsp. japonica TaxID=39947 RepID=A0A0P0XBJ5_ORYSJ|nr:hypothetical protein EE612_041899 [Oryza sativa]BAT03648.1 Os08g0125250 [Oryza sativa Japonica Group]
MEMDIKAAVGNELVHEEELIATVAPTDELHEIAVAQPTYHLDLRLVLLPPLLGGVFGEPFYGNVYAELSQIATVHRAKTALPKLLLRRKALCRVDKYVVWEPPRPRPHLDLHDGIAFRVVLLFLPHLLSLTSSYEDCYHGEEEHDEQNCTDGGSRYNSATRMLSCRLLLLQRQVEVPRTQLMLLKG